MSRILLLLSAAGLLLTTGCRKDDAVSCSPVPAPAPASVPPSTPTSNLTLAEFTRRNGAPVQTFPLVLGPTFAPQVFTTTSRAEFTIPGAGFLLPNGSAATGTAQVRVREIYSVPDMLLSNMPTQTAGGRQLLVSGGEFSIQVWQGSTRLRLAGTARLVVTSPVPAGASGRQQLWQEPASLVGTDSTGWKLVPPTSASDTIRLATVAAANALHGYQTPIPLDSVSWWNIDQVWQRYFGATMGTVTVQVPAVPTGRIGTAVVFVRPVGYNSLGKLYPGTSPTAWSAQLPVGVSMVAIVLQSVNGQLYYGTQPFTTQNNLNLTPPLTAVSEADALRLIRQL